MVYHPSTTDQKITEISPIVALMGTVLGIILIFLPKDFNDILFVLICLFLGITTTRNLRSVAFFLKLSIPIILPLFIVHVVINPTFPVDYYLFNTIPIRSNGLEFAIHITRQILLLFATSTLWFFISRDKFFDWLIARKFPLFIYAAFAQAIAIISLIERRGSAVYQAQQARGIRTGPDFITKIRALPSVMLPVIATIINETDWRTIALISRGFTCTKMSSPPVPFLNKFDSLRLSILVLPLLLKIIIWKL